MTSRAAALHEADVLRALESVIDPELEMSVVKLGLIYETAIAGRDVRVVMTLTAPGCPLHGVMTDGVREAIARLPGVERVEVALTFDPPWSPDRIRD